MLDEVKITKAIIDRYFQKLSDHLDIDVAVVGGGPSGLVLARYLAQAGVKTALYERKLSIGGGMWGGGMMFNEIVVQEEAVSLLEDANITVCDNGEGYFTADSVEAASGLVFAAKKAGAAIFNCVSVEDVVMREKEVIGLVLNWSPVEMAGLHIDPLAIRAKHVVDATGHAVEVVHFVQNKVPGKLLTPSGTIEGEKSMWAENAEKLTLENTREVFPGLSLAGMAANAVFGGPRMGPIFGGMLLSGKKCAEELIKKLT